MIRNDDDVEDLTNTWVRCPTETDAVVPSSSPLKPLFSLSRKAPSPLPPSLHCTDVVFNLSTFAYVAI